MQPSAWEEIEKLYHYPQIAPATVKLFQTLKTSQTSHTKEEGNPRHYCSFFLPYDQAAGKIYLGHHKKANDWIPPGGHIEPGETPSQAAIRELQEELGVKITTELLVGWNLSVKPINRPHQGCVAHYDVWHLVHLPVQPFAFLKSEYHDAGWFTIPDGLAKITQNPDFAQIIAKLLSG